MTAIDVGRIATRGTGFRARAEARQREYRVNTLQVGCSEWGHWLDDASVEAGRNFVVPEAHHAALERARAGKGVGERTFRNMLSSQAMCFNLFAPLACDLTLATTVLRPLLPGLRAITVIHFEYTPTADVFGDQTGRGGVDCDLLIEADWNDGERAVVVIETKYVEPEFSSCGFRAAGRAASGKAVCPSDVGVRADSTACLYQSRKSYRYWDRSIEHGNLDRQRLPQSGCPFGGPVWQLWVNHTLAHVEASQRGVAHAIFAVCAPLSNEALLRDGNVLDDFRALVANPATVALIPLDQLVANIAGAAGEEPKLRSWASALAARYAGI